LIIFISPKNKMSAYSKITAFGEGGGNSPMNNPLTYCTVSPLDAEFNHTLGATFGPYSFQCQQFMAGYCANNFDGVCEYMSQNKDTRFPAYNGNSAIGSSCSSAQGLGAGTSLGENLVRQTAMEKYLVKMSSNCVRKYQPFDPTVANSPLIGTWYPVSGGSCIPIYAVDVSVIDNDPLMNKILINPKICLDVLINIYNNSRNGVIPAYWDELKNTKLGRLLASDWFQSQMMAYNNGKSKKCSGGC